MLYHFLVPLAEHHIVFNVFRYLTFRSFMALITALVISLVIGPWIIARLREHAARRGDDPRGHAGAPPHEEGHADDGRARHPGRHARLDAPVGQPREPLRLGRRARHARLRADRRTGTTGASCASARGSRRGRSSGCSSCSTLALLQIVFWQPAANGWAPVLAIPFLKGWLLDLGWLWIPFAMLVIVGASNAVNLTDGLDGLAIGPVIMAGGAFGIIAYLTGNFRAADYLKILNVQGRGRADRVLRRAHRRRHRLPLVQLPSRRRSSWATWARWRWAARIGMLAVLTKAELLLPLIGGLYVVEAALRHHPGGELQAHRQARLPDGAAPPPLRARRLVGAEDRRALLDRLLRARAAGADAR